LRTKNTRLQLARKLGCLVRVQADQIRGTRTIFQTASRQPSVGVLSAHHWSITMQTSDRGLATLAGHEGIVLHPYRDSVGVWTIGIGHTAAAGAPNPQGVQAMTVAEAMALFRRDVAKYEREVLSAVKVPLAQHEFDALVSFHYNTGGIAKAKLTAALNRGDRAGAAAGFMGWLKPPEIEGRRRAEQTLFAKGTYGDGFASVYTATDGNVNRSSAKRINVIEALGSPAAPDPVDPPPEAISLVAAAAELRALADRLDPPARAGGV
jgi:lysozyme